jgi:glutamine synthetase type III
VSNGEEIRLEAVEQQYVIYCYRLLQKANETGEYLDPKVFDTVSRFMKDIGIRDSEGPSISPEIMDAVSRAKKLAEKQKGAKG